MKISIKRVQNKLAWLLPSVRNLSNNRILTLSVLSFCLSLVSCGDNGKRDSALSANRYGAVTRAHWQAERKPVVIETDTIVSECIGVSMLLRDATSDEFNALQSARFDLQEKVYRANDHNALTSDSSATTGICFPVHRGAKATSAIDMKAPFGENLYGKEVNRSFGAETKIRYLWRSGMALLRIVTESNDVRDYLNRLTIVGDYIYTTGLYMPYTGEWCEKKADWSIDATDADCLLNNGRNHDFYLIPTDTAGIVSFRAVINGRDRVLKKTLPPMLAGSLTELHLKATDKDFVVSSSWVDGKRKLYIQNKKDMVKDSVQLGYFLQSNGDIVKKRDDKTIAVVCEVENDGRHGKAVALSDSKDKFVFSNAPLPTGKDFSTIDGKRTEGVLNPNRNTDIADENKVIWTPKMQYNDMCALGFTDGAGLTHLLLRRSNKVLGQARGIKFESMIEETQRHPCSYIPSLGELVRLYYLVKQKKIELPELTPLEGEYLTSSERGSQYYMIDFSTGVIISSLSKQYGAAQLRLFYLF